METNSCDADGHYTGHVLRWHLRIMMHPRAMSGPVDRAYSSAPKAAAMQMSRGVFSCPSVCSLTLSLRSFKYKCLLRFNAQLPGQARAFNTRPGRRPRPPSPPDTTM